MAAYGRQPRACIRRPISSGETSSVCVAIAHVWPNGSTSCAKRSPQNMSLGGATPCAPAFTAQPGSGYYAYVANKFPNTLTVVDADPNNDGDLSDGVVVGRVLLTATASTALDDVVIALPGMGGQGC